jgi:hypothetical protein
MGNMDYQRGLKLSFPLAFAFVYTVFYWILVGSSPVLAMHLPSVFWLFSLLSIASLPFIIPGIGNPAMWIPGAVLLALLCGAVQYLYGKRITGDWRWQLGLVVLVTWVQSGLLLAVSFLFILWSTH